MTDAPTRDVVQRGLCFEEFEEGVLYLHRPGARSPRPTTCCSRR